MEFMTVLFVIFLILKLTGVILWSWWFVTAPLWLGLIVSVIFYFFFATFFKKFIELLFNSINKF